MFVTVSYLLTVFLFNLTPHGCAKVSKVYRRPEPVQGTTLDVMVTLTLLDLNSIRLIEMDYRLDYYVNFEWEINNRSCSSYADKLEEGGIITSEQREPGDVIFINGNEIKLFWIPDTYVAEVKSIEAPNTPEHNLLLTMEIYNDLNCKLKYETRQAAIVGCKMDFHDYPYDRQQCTFRIRSHFSPLPLVRYQWNTSGVTFGEYLHLNHYEIRFNYSQYNSTMHGLSYSWLKVDFIFQRKLSHFIVQVVFPSIIIIIIAYSSCWVDVDSGTSRFQLTVGTFLSLITKFVGIKEDLPPVSYFTALDFWMFGSMMFAFSAIIEVVLVNYLYTGWIIRIKKKRLDTKQKIKYLNEIIDQQAKNSESYARNQFRGAGGRRASEANAAKTDTLELDPSLDTVYTRSFSIADMEMELKEPNYALRCDLACRVIYPIAFAIFFAVFWSFLINRKFT